jgi:superfamily II DNA or RNA helicase
MSPPLRTQAPEPPLLRGVRTAAEARRILATVTTFAQRATTILATPAALRESARQQADELKGRAVTARLQELPITALRGSVGQGARLSQLQKVGYRTVGDLLTARSHVLDAVPGVGPRTVEQVMAAARSTERRVRDDTPLRFDPDHRDRDQTQLLATLAALHSAEQVARSLNQPLRMFVNQTSPLVQQAELTGSHLRMLFSRSRKRNAACQALAELEAILADPRVIELHHRIRDGQTAGDPSTYSPNQLWQHYLRNAASVNAVLSTVSGSGPDEEETAAGFLPEELRQKINAVPLDTTLLTVTLRGYQVFGAQYAIHQQRSILGDEMGLGKTVQGLAAIAHLAARGQRRFLVVCPASVQINWLHETRKHTRLQAHSLHGADRDNAARRWLHQGGVAVTTFGTLARLPDAVRSAGAALLIVDEAHFIKNPGAARSRAVKAAVAGAQRVLFLTGTPMENRVQEFRSLVDYLQPHIAARVSADDAVAGARAFRRAVAPVYLRRNQEDVLHELPDKIEVEDWVQHSKEDEAAYVAAVRAQHLMDMRQAAYRSPSSAKLERLEQIVDEASEDQRKVVIFSYFLHVLATVGSRLDFVVGTITGAVPPSSRQQMVDQFTNHHGHAVLLNQIEAGGVGINLQAASIVIITEPQWKPSTEDQAIARAHRMGQVRTVQVHRLLAKDSVDERIREIQENKALLFAEYARRSDAKEADRRATDTTWHRPAELDDAALPLERRVILAEEHRLSAHHDGS